MLEPRVVVTNTTPLIALTAATGGLEVLRALYSRVIFPMKLVRRYWQQALLVWVKKAFLQADWLEKRTQAVAIPHYLSNALDVGEASVIQTALQENLALVLIDETVGRRFARLCELQIAGSIGILLKAQKQSYPLDMKQALANMRAQGIWLSDWVVNFALAQSDLGNPSNRRKH